MLNIRVEPGQNLDKGISASSSALKALIGRAQEVGSSRIVAYPSSESLSAAILLFSYMSRRGLPAYLSVATRPPSVIDVPTALFGFGSLGYTNESDKDQLVAFAASISEPPPLNATYISVDGSLGVALAMALRAVNERPLEPDLKVFALASSYGSRYIDKVGKVMGLDRIYVETLFDDEAVSLNMVTYVKSYRPHMLDLCSSLSITLDPFFPGLTGNRDSCARQAAEAGLGQLANRRASEISDAEAATVAKAVMGMIKDRVRRQYEVSDYVGGVYVASDRLTIVDPREAKGLIEMAHDLGGLGLAAALISQFEDEYPQAVASLPRLAVRLAELVDESRVSEEGAFMGVRLYRVRSDFRPPLYLLWRALTLTGIIDRNSLLAHEDERGLRLSLLQASEVLGPSSLARLQADEDVEVEGGFAWLRRKSA